MRTQVLAAGLVVLAGAHAEEVSAGDWRGSVALGGVVVDESGDRSAVQETYNVYDGFSVTRLRLSGTPDERHYVSFDLHEINLDARRGRFSFRHPGIFKLDGSFDQHRQVFDPERLVSSERKHWGLRMRGTPTPWLSLSGSFSNTTRDGDRLSFPEGTGSVLGTGYDNALRTGRFAAEARAGRRGVEVAYRASDFDDDLNPESARTGRIVSARLFGPCVLTDRWTHLVRGAFGTSEATNTSGSDIDYEVYTFRYTGVVRPYNPVHVTYTFDAQRLKHDTTRRTTDQIHNRFDATYTIDRGSLSGGYSYETNDDDRSPTSHHGWRAAASYRQPGLLSAKVRYAGRVKNDTEARTLLKESESSRVRADLEVTPLDGFAVGATFNARDREFPDIDVRSEGHSVRGFARYEVGGWGRLSGEYDRAEDEYVDLVGRFDTLTEIVSVRLDFDHVDDLRLSSGLTFIDAERDVDIEKIAWSLEGRYAFLEDWGLEVQYNLFDYEDFILLDRYYQADIVRFNVTYDLRL